MLEKGNSLRIAAEAEMLGRCTRYIEAISYEGGRIA